MKTRWLLALLVILISSLAPGADWPQWRGPTRDDISKETGLLAKWPKEGPKLVWTFEDAGKGFAGLAVVGDRVYSMGADAKTEFVFALDAGSGKKLWSTPIGPLYTNGWGDGPRGTPTVEGNFLYAISAAGNLASLDTKGGKQRWSASFTQAGGRTPNWGYTESPLIDGNKIVCTPGAKGGTFAALDKTNGKPLWFSKEITDGAAYSSIIAADVGGVRQYINMTSQGVAAVAANDGRLLWKSGEAKNGTAVIPTPIFHDNSVFVTSGYGAGCALLELAPQGKVFDAKAAYSNKNMINHHGGVVLVDGNLYGYSDKGGWVCMDFKKGTVLWSSRGVGKGSCTVADGKLYCYSEDNGAVALVDLNPKAYTELSRFTIPRTTKLPRKSGKIWTHPVVANGKLYLRDQDLIFCFDVSGK